MRHGHHNVAGKDLMRIHAYVLTIALCAAAGQAAPGQTQGQAGASASQPAGAKQSASPIAAQPASALPTANKSNATTKPAVVLTDDNFNDPGAREALRSKSVSNAQQDSKGAPKPGAAASKPQPEQQAAAQAASAKPKLLLDKHKVLTNDDLQKMDTRHGASVVGLDVDLGAIYDCDINCYDRARNDARIYPGTNLEWMRDLRSGIEDLKKDNAWRALLVHLAHLRAQFCTLADEETTELNRADNFNNVTDQQINIREEYNRKLNAANQDVVAAYRQLTPLQAPYSPMVRSFMQAQVLRVMQSGCSSPDSTPRNYDPDDPDE
jgi:hypothetical protein